MDLAERFHQAVSVEDHQQPDLGAIAARGRQRAHSKRVASGLASVTVLAVGALGLVSSIQDSPELVEAADGSLAVEIGDEDRSLVSLGEREPEPGVSDTGQSSADVEQDLPAGSVDGEDSASATAEEAVDVASGEVEAQPLIEALAASFELCYGYDNEGGAGAVEVWMDADQNISIDERRLRGSDDNPDSVFRFRGEGRADGLRVEASGRYEADGQQTPVEETRTFVFGDGLGTLAGPQFIYTAVNCEADSVVVEAAGDGLVADGYGGSLMVTDDGRLVHEQADGSTVVIELPRIEADVVQRWPTDIAQLNGTSYLFIDEFVNRPTLSPDEVDFEVSILALNLETDELIEVERRPITSTASPEWIYNGHITTNGEQILVMRELWQSACLYAEAINIDGTAAEAPETVGLELPRSVGVFSEDVLAQLGVVDGPAELGCLTLDDIDDGGIGVLGRQADAASFNEFAADFLLAFG